MALLINDHLQLFMRRFCSVGGMLYRQNVQSFGESDKGKNVETMNEISGYDNTHKKDGLFCNNMSKGTCKMRKRDI